LPASLSITLGYLGIRLLCAPQGQSISREDHSLKVRSVEDRLDELERLKRRDMVTPEEYAAKRQEILKDL
jgi:hypothetical protein